MYMYSLKLFDKTLIKFNMDNRITLKISDIEIVSDEVKLYPEALQEKVTPDTIKDFLEQRIIPKNRTFVKNILESQGLDLKDIKGVIDVSKGLSLTDCYWIVEDDNLKFNDFNLFDNNFSEILSLIAFTGYTSKIKGIATSPEFTTDGALPKGWRRICNKVFLYKGSTEYLKASNGGNEPYSEYYVYQLEQKLGIKSVEYGLEKWKGMLASTCELFTTKEFSYVPIYQASHSKDIESVHNWCCENDYEEEFADMIMLDALTFNWDRHLGNFGVLKNNETGEYTEFAPLFDNGAGLLSDAPIEIFKSQKQFEDYWKNNKELQKSNYGGDYRELVKAYCGKKQIAKLRNLANFKFQKHPKYNLSDDRLKYLNNMIQERSIELISTIEKKITNNNYSSIVDKDELANENEDI